MPAEQDRIAGQLIAQDVQQAPDIVELLAQPHVQYVLAWRRWNDAHRRLAPKWLSRFLADRFFQAPGLANAVALDEHVPPLVGRFLAIWSQCPVPVCRDSVGQPLSKPSLIHPLEQYLGRRLGDRSAVQAISLIKVVEIAGLAKAVDAQRGHAMPKNAAEPR